jgi:hypothetical protein
MTHGDSAALTPALSQRERENKDVRRRVRCGQRRTGVRCFFPTRECTSRVWKNILGTAADWPTVRGVGGWERRSLTPVVLTWRRRRPSLAHMETKRDEMRNNPQSVSKTCLLIMCPNPSRRGWPRSAKVPSVDNAAQSVRPLCRSGLGRFVCVGSIGAGGRFQEEKFDSPRSWGGRGEAREERCILGVDCRPFEVIERRRVRERSPRLVVCPFRTRRRWCRIPGLHCACPGLF